MGKRLLISGGRSHRLTPQAFDLLKKLNDKLKFTLLLNGMATGIDKEAREWAKKEGIPIKEFSADWSLGKRAGPLRNQLMVNELQSGDYAVFFMGNRGTDGCYELARNSPASIIDYRNRTDLIR